MTTTLKKLVRTASLAAAGLASMAFAAQADVLSDKEAAMAKDLTVAQKPVYELGSQPGNQIGVDAWLDNPDHVYAVGRPLRLMVRPKQDAHITILNVGTSGRVAVIYPNHFQRETRVRAGQTVVIPSERSNWNITVSGPTGIELIKVIASREPLNLAELQKLAGANAQNPVLTLGRSGEQAARDLVPQLKPANIGVRNLLIRVVQGQAGMPAFPPAFAAVNPFAAQKGTFGLIMRVEKPVYKVGEMVRVAIAAERDCRLTLVSVGPSGSAVQLFPNAYQRENLILAGQTVLIPSIQSPVQFQARGPSGIEGLIATCRAVSWQGPAIAQAETGFASVGDVRSLGRDLAVAGGQAGAVETEQLSSSYIVVE